MCTLFSPLFSALQLTPAVILYSLSCIFSFFVVQKRCEADTFSRFLTHPQYCDSSKVISKRASLRHSSSFLFSSHLCSLRTLCCAYFSLSVTFKNWESVTLFFYLDTSILQQHCRSLRKPCSFSPPFFLLLYSTSAFYLFTLPCDCLVSTGVQKN